MHSSVFSEIALEIFFINPSEDYNRRVFKKKKTITTSEITLGFTSKILPGIPPQSSSKNPSNMNSECQGSH